MYFYSRVVTLCSDPGYKSTLSELSFRFEINGDILKLGYFSKKLNYFCRKLKNCVNLSKFQRNLQGEVLKKLKNKIARPKKLQINCQTLNVSRWSRRRVAEVKLQQKFLQTANIDTLGIMSLTATILAWLTLADIQTDALDWGHSTISNKWMSMSNGNGKMSNELDVMYQNVPGSLGVEEVGVILDTLVATLERLFLLQRLLRKVLRILLRILLRLLL